MPSAERPARSTRGLGPCLVLLGPALGCDSEASARWLPVAALAAEPEALDLGAMSVAGEARGSLAVTNTGHAVAELGVVAAPPFAVVPAAIVLAPGETADLLVTATLPAVGAFDGTLALGALRVPVHVVGEADHDGDGYASERVAGSDCDDDDAATHPGAPESSEDAVDRDCNGVPGDADADGYPAGPDCDDDDATAHPGAPERIDGRDDDCDGRVDESAVGAGALVLSEFRRAAPSWAEFCVPADRSPVAVGGFSLAADDREIALDPATVEAGDCLAVCAAAMEGCAQVADLALGAAAFLYLRADAVVDVVEVGALADAGDQAWSLDPSKLDAEENDAATAWCRADGSAGSPNPPCEP